MREVLFPLLRGEFLPPVASPYLAVARIHDVEDGTIPRRRAGDLEATIGASIPSGGSEAKGESDSEEDSGRE